MKGVYHVHTFIESFIAIIFIIYFLVLFFQNVAHSYWYLFFIYNFHKELKLIRVALYKKNKNLL